MIAPIFRRAAHAALLALVFCHAARAQVEPTYTAQQLRADVHYLRDAIATTHPDPGFSADPQRLQAVYERIDAQLAEPLTRDQAWRLLATLNPVYADGHLAITQPDPRGQSERLLQSGAGFFPYEMVVGTDGGLTIRTQLGGAATTEAGLRIDRINGVPASRIVAELLDRCHGDTPAFRASLLSARWPFMYWKMYGAAASFDLVTADGTQLRRAAGHTLPAYWNEHASFGQQFNLEMLPKHAALLTINTFYWPEKRQFTDFTENAFRQIREAGVTTLLIDVRGNGGGNDDMWIDGVLRYIADKPFRWASRYKKKVIQGRTSETEKLGDIIEGSIEKWIPPQPDDPLHFDGKTYLLVGRHTYSSAVLFSNVMQDFRFGQLVGASGDARVRQSGGMQNFVLPNTGLEVGVPRLIFERPSGAATPVLIQPDIVLPDSPFNRRQLIEAVLSL